MAFSNNHAATAWGDTHLYLGEPESNGDMSKNLEDLGIIDEDGLTMETADGNALQLKDINGKLIDELTQEPELTLNFTLLKPSEETRGKFWDMEESGSGDSRKVNVKSLVTLDKYSIKFANPKMAGSETFEAPYCSVTMKPNWSASKGFYAECSAKILMGDANYLFGFGVVPAATGTAE